MATPIRIVPTTCNKSDQAIETLGELTELVAELREIHHSIADLAATQPAISARVRRLQRIADRYTSRIDASTELLIGRLERR